MKQSALDKLERYKKELQVLKKEISALPGKTVNRTKIRDHADAIATLWVEELRSSMEHKFGIDKSTIEDTAALMKKLHVLSRPNNLKSSYISVIGSALKNFDDKFILPIKQKALQIENIFDLAKLVPGLADPTESEYLSEAISCAQAGHKRAAIVMGWCAVIARLQQFLVQAGLNNFNTCSSSIKKQTSGKFKNWNKEFSVTTLSELQTVFDTDLIVVLEGMGKLDGNQAERLKTCFQYRNHSAHPGRAPIEDANVVAFFSDVSAIVLKNPTFKIPP